jgi:predicted methyltransferase
MKIRLLKQVILATIVATLAATGALAATPKDLVLSEVIAGDWRSTDEKSRDAARKPVENLQFWGLKPGASILEVQPGAGWWTRILAPYAARTGGRYSATAADLANPSITDAARKGRADFAARFADDKIYGTVELVNWGATAAPLVANSYDFILLSRVIHGWMRIEGLVDRHFASLAVSLKPGGVLGVEQHRANPGPQDPKAESGYVTEAYVIAAAEKAGLRLADRSQINANPNDSKDHPFGVWTLPPTRSTVPYGSGKAPDPNFDRSKYDAIGESDRMTLRFVKAAP